MINDVKKELTIIPEIISEEELYDFVFIAIKKIRIAENIPKKMAKNGINFNKIIETEEKIPDRNMAKEQPKDAPAEIPRVKGSAKGFFNISCITNPLTANTAPMMKDEIKEGSLMLIMTV